MRIQGIHTKFEYQLTWGEACVWAVGIKVEWISMTLFALKLGNVFAVCKVILCLKNTIAEIFVNDWKTNIYKFFQFLVWAM